MNCRVYELFIPLLCTGIVIDIINTTAMYLCNFRINRVLIIRNRIKIGIQFILFESDCSELSL